MLSSQVRAMEKRAATMFFYHLQAMGYDAWDFEGKTNECVETVKRLACYTYFPRCQKKAQKGEKTAYLRPCSSSCLNMINTCGVECCDESVTCSFTHTKTVAGKTYQTKGYVDREGPSAYCTGGSSRAGPGAVLFLLGLIGLDSIAVFASIFRSRKFMLFAFALLIAVSFSGCKEEAYNADVPTHTVGNWRRKPDYLLTNAYMPADAPAGSPGMLNSCMLSISPSVQCSGRGSCEEFKYWRSTEDKEKKEDTSAVMRDMSVNTTEQGAGKIKVDSKLKFCKCSRDWAGSECQDKRKSQLTAYFLSIFFGLFGADQFYLGFPVWGALKLCTLGGLGIWWLADVIRIGSSAPQSNSYRCAKDLPHWAFVLTCIGFAFIVGFIVMVVTT
eukprot:gene171-43_t